MNKPGDNVIDIQRTQQDHSRLRVWSKRVFWVLAIFFGLALLSVLGLVLMAQFGDEVENVNNIVKNPNSMELIAMRCLVYLATIGVTIQTLDKHGLINQNLTKPELFTGGLWVALCIELLMVQRVLSQTVDGVF